MKVYTYDTDIKLEARIKNARERGDVDRWIELRLARGDDPLDVCADLAAQDG